MKYRFSNVLLKYKEFCRLQKGSGYLAARWTLKFFWLPDKLLESDSILDAGRANQFCLPICVCVCVWEKEREREREIEKAPILWNCYSEGFVSQIRRHTPNGFNKKWSHIHLVCHETSWLCFHALNSPNGFARTWQTVCITHEIFPEAEIQKNWEGRMVRLEQRVIPENY